MAKILNLDTFETSSDKQVVLNKVTHQFHPFTVEEFIAQVKEIEELEAKGAVSATEYAQFMVKTVLRGFPTIPVDELQKMEVEKLRAISDFVRDVAQAAKTEAEEQVSAEGNEPGAAS